MTDTDPAVSVWRCAWTEHVRNAKRYATDEPIAVPITVTADFDTHQAADHHALGLALTGRLVGEAAIYEIPIHPDREASA